jgi:Prion-inhibition and propagation
MEGDSKSPDSAGEKKALALVLAGLYSDSVECFGMIHAGKKSWDRSQQLFLTKLGIQQARLLAWGDFVRIWDVSDDHDAALDDPTSRTKIETTLRTILDMHKTVDKTKQLEKYGLKATKLGIENLEHAVDLIRLEAFRERFALIGPTHHSPTISGLHWLITDTKKVLPFVSEIRALIDSLISQFELESRVSHAVKSDIRGLAWHPVFERIKATADGSKLQLIKESCAEWYPEFSEAAHGALTYLNKEWNDSYEEAMANSAYRFRLPSSVSDAVAKKAQADAKKAHDDAKKAHDDAKKAHEEAKKARADAKIAEAAAANQQYSLEKLKEKYTRVDGKSHQTEAHQRPKRLSIFSHFKPRSWRGNSTTSEEATRSLSHSAVQHQSTSGAEDDTNDLVPERSRSMIVMPTRSLIDALKDKHPDLSTTETNASQENGTEPADKQGDDTIQSVEQEPPLQPITSMASRHDYWRASIG